MKTQRRIKTHARSLERARTHRHEDTIEQRHGRGQKYSSIRFFIASHTRSGGAAM